MNDLGTELGDLAKRFSEFDDVESVDAALSLEVARTRALLMIVDELAALNRTLQARGGDDRVRSGDAP